VKSKAEICEIRENPVAKKFNGMIVPYYFMVTFDKRIMKIDSYLLLLYILDHKSRCKYRRG